VVWLVDVDTPALLAALVTVWLPGVAVAAAEWSGSGAGGCHVRWVAGGLVAGYGEHPRRR